MKRLRLRKKTSIAEANEARSEALTRLASIKQASHDDSPTPREMKVDASLIVDSISTLHAALIHFLRIASRFKSLAGACFWSVVIPL